MDIPRAGRPRPRSAPCPTCPPSRSPPSPSKPGPIPSSTRWGTTSDRSTSSASGWACSARVRRGCCGGWSAGSTSAPTAIALDLALDRRRARSRDPVRTALPVLPRRSIAAVGSGPPSRSASTPSGCAASSPRSPAPRSPACRSRCRHAHTAWVEGPSANLPVDQLRERARGLALSLLELGEDVETTERQLHTWRLHPAIAHEAVAWAVARRTAVTQRVPRDDLPPEAA